MEHSTLHAILTEQINAKGFSLEELKEASGISERYLAALVSGEYDSLPATPYVRGYLHTLALLLGLNGEQLWAAYQREARFIKSSGSDDALPQNRFALKSVSRTGVALVAALILALGYALLNADRFLGSAEVRITEPASDTLVTSLGAITLAGSIHPNDKLTIGGEEVVVAPDGSFTKSYTLEPGLNRIEFSVKKLIGGETNVVRTVIYQP